MNAHVRKQPERRPQGQARKGRSSARAPAPPPRRPNIVITGLVALGGLAARNPTLIGGTCAFIVVFSFVAANALWYQPGGHPAPFLKMRSADNSLGFTATRPEPHDVTTFVIERAEEDEPLPEITDVTPAERPFDEVAKAIEGTPVKTQPQAEVEEDPVAAAIMRAAGDQFCCRSSKRSPVRASPPCRAGTLPGSLYTVSWSLTARTPGTRRTARSSGRTS